MSGTGYSPPADHPVFVGGVALNTSGSGSHGAVGVRVRNVIGWMGEGVEVRDMREQRPGRDGEFADTQYLAGRTVTFEGTVMGSSYADLQSRKLTLAATFAGIAATEGEVKMPTPSASSPSFSYSSSMASFERVSARLTGGGVSWGERFGLWGQRWQVSVRASDPRILSDVATSSDSGTTGTATRTVTVDQGGTYETPVTLTVTGPTASTWSVSNPTTGLLIGMSGLTLPSTGSVTFNTLDRTATYTDTYEIVRTSRSDLVALWMLDESAGTVADNEQGAAARDGTYTGGYTLNQTGPFTGITSVDLNGSTGYVSTTFQSALATTTFTFDAWVYPDTLVTGACIASCAQAAGGGWRLFIDSAGRLFVQMANSSGTDVAEATSAPGAITTASWQHVALVMDGPTASPRLYVNGQLVASGTNSGTYAAPTTQGLHLGSYAAAALARWDGKLAAAGYYSTAIPAATISEWYTGAGDTATVGSAYGYLVGGTARWKHLGTASSTFSLASGGLSTGSKLNVTYRDARL